MHLYLFSAVLLLGLIIGVITFFITNAVDKKKPRTIVRASCKSSRWGCCPDGIIPKYDLRGTNCVPRPRHGGRHHRFLPPSMQNNMSSTQNLSQTNNMDSTQNLSQTNNMDSTQNLSQTNNMDSTQNLPSDFPQLTSRPL